MPVVCQGLCWELNSRQKDKRGQQARDCSGQHRWLRLGTGEGQSWESLWEEGIKPWSQQEEVRNSVPPLPEVA